MWSPTHIQVTVQRAKGLLTKGKNGTNNCFVTISLGKEKYQTSVKDKAEMNVSWNEECELKIPDQGNRAELVLTCLHRNNLAIDEFLGQATLPLNEMDVYDRPRSKWFRLESKPGKEKKNKERGELEVRISFVVKSGSLTDLSKKDKHKSSIGQLASSVGGSLLSIGQIEKRKGIKKFAKSLGSKMHLHSKKKNKDGDDVSISSSYASIGTPNGSQGGSQRYGQRAGEADPGVISEDEDEFVFDNLSHKSSGSSLNIRSGLQPPSQNYAPRNPSPLLAATAVKAGGKQLSKSEVAPAEETVVDPELEEIEHDFSIRARTLPPPSKPPRTPQLGTEVAPAPVFKAAENEPKVDEWETKLYGKHVEIGSSDSLKRRSWAPTPVPVPLRAANEETKTEIKLENKEEMKTEPKEVNTSTDSDSSSSESESEEEFVPEPVKEVKMVQPQPQNTPIKLQSEVQQEKDTPPKIQETQEEKPLTPQEEHPLPQSSPTKPQTLSLNTSTKFKSSSSLLSPEADKDFDEYNASFAQYEQINSDKIYGSDLNKKWSSGAFIAQESLAPTVPQAQPRNRSRELELKKAQEEEEERKRQAAVEAAAVAAAAAAAAQLKREREEAAEAEAKRRRAEEDARLEAELRLNEERLREEEAALQEVMRLEEEKRRENKRREEDQMILNFAKRSTSLIENGNAHDEIFGTPEQSPKDWGERTAEKREKRLIKYKHYNKREDGSNSPSPKSNERIIIGHERASTHAERRAEISNALAKKYEGKSREELMLIANGMETEALLQRQRVKELEDYLDNLLLRVMETHPKILQNPYSRTTSAKSG